MLTGSSADKRQRFGRWIRSLAFSAVVSVLCGAICWAVACYGVRYFGDQDLGITNFWSWVPIMVGMTAFNAGPITKFFSRENARDAAIALACIMVSSFLLKTVGLI